MAGPKDQATTARDLENSYADLVDHQARERTAASPPAEASPPPPLRIIEALLFVGGTPLTAARAAEIIRGLGPEQFSAILDELNHDYRRQGRPYTIEPRDHGHVLTLRPGFQGVVDRLHGGIRTARLSLGAVDVLALVAYRQPIAKVEIDSLRGAESGALLRQLVRRGLIQVLPRGDTKSRDLLYATTARFLDLFGLHSLDDLPRTQDLQQI